MAHGEKVAYGSETHVLEKNGAPETIRTSDKRFRKANEDEEATDCFSWKWRIDAFFLVL